MAVTHGGCFLQCGDCQGGAMHPRPFGRSLSAAWPCNRGPSESVVIPFRDEGSVPSEKRGTGRTREPLALFDLQGHSRAVLGQVRVSARMLLSGRAIDDVNFMAHRNGENTSERLIFHHNTCCSPSRPVPPTPYPWCVTRPRSTCGDDLTLAWRLWDRSLLCSTMRTSPRVGQVSLPLCLSLRVSLGFRDATQRAFSRGLVGRDFFDQNK